MDLFGGNDGLYFYRKIFKDVRHVLKDLALLAFEMGFDQRELMSQAVEQYFPGIPYEIIKDINGKDRMLFIYYQDVYKRQGLRNELLISLLNPFFCQTIMIMIM